MNIYIYIYTYTRICGRASARPGFFLPNPVPNMLITINKFTVLQRHIAAFRGKTRMELRNGDQEAPGRHRIFPKWSKAGSGSACVSATAPKRARCVCQSKMCGRSFGVHSGSTVSPKAEKDAAHQPSRAGSGGHFP